MESTTNEFQAMRLTDEQVAEQFKNCIAIYPTYFDIRKSIREGRKVPKHLAVNTDLKNNGIPITAWHLASACEKLGIACLVEDGKRYPRDYWGYGRIRVKFDKLKGIKHPQHGHIKNKYQLMVALAKLLPDVQKAQLESLRSSVDKSKAQTGISAEYFDFPLKPESFPYSSDPKANAAIKYSYGALPLGDLRPKTSSGESSKSKKKK